MDDYRAPGSMLMQGGWSLFVAGAANPVLPPILVQSAVQLKLTIWHLLNPQANPWLAGNRRGR